MKSDIIDELFRKYYNEALLYTLSLCRNLATAEDIVQTAFYKALASADDSIGNFKAWLLTVCRNEFLMMCRSDLRFTDEELSEDLRDEREETLDRIIRDEQYRELYRAIDRLPGRQREIVELYYFQNMRASQIAELTGISTANVKVLLHRARTQIRQEMEV